MISSPLLCSPIFNFYLAYIIFNAEENPITYISLKGKYDLKISVLRC